MTYINRRDAGKRLAKALDSFKGGDVVVLALPRGGVVLGAEVARYLKAPLGLVLVRKIGHPSYPEYAIGAVAEEYEPVYSQVGTEDINKAWLNKAEADAKKLIKRRRELYYGRDFEPPEIVGKTVLIVDDGIATGLTMLAAVKAVVSRQAIYVVVAVPVAPLDSVQHLGLLADEVIVLDDPNNFLGAVGAHYQEFEQVNDEEVRTLLREVRDEVRQAASAGPLLTGRR